jgi:hypothetical protein
MAAIKFKLIKNFFTQKELNVLQKYCYNKVDQSTDYKIDNQSFSPGWYNDPLMNAILDTKLPLVEKKSKLKLFPTYAYWRYYVFGATLAKHTDRPSCEISITACVKKYDNWPMIVEGNKFELEEGDGVLYAGCEQEHGRPNVYEGEGMAQVFFHYVNKKGPFTHHAYDKYLSETGKIVSEEDEIILNKKYK